ncbi:hypothetical protein PCASD_15725 [Puccinia coronata f. sp. avenae]|uniref:Uncharacterized protein n=1 Tax=Puccinia coronata f. sp. avenae TaxID=200324 RepID=A0A2N5SWN6_9BASI|nr:hypothetical protein PCASD_15725 [Puccinia coronata f. sp. avenae]
MVNNIALDPVLIGKSSVLTPSNAAATPNVAHTPSNVAPTPSNVVAGPSNVVLSRSARVQGLRSSVRINPDVPNSTSSTPPIAPQPSNSMNPSNQSSTTQKKRPRRTKAEMAAYREELACAKKLKAAEKEKAKAKKKAPRPCSKAAQSRAPAPAGTQSANSDDLPDSNGPFILDDYANICSYLADEHWAENTGAGVEERDGTAIFNEALEARCPCYDRLYAIFGAKANITPLRQHESRAGADLYGDDSDMIDNESDELGSDSNADSSPEVMYSGWDATQNPSDPLRGNNGNINVNLGENAHNEPDMEDDQNDMTMSNHADSDAERLPPPLDFPPLEFAPDKSPRDSHRVPLAEDISHPDSAPPQLPIASTADKPTTTPNPKKPPAQKTAQLLATAPGASDASASRRRSFPNQGSRQRSSQCTPSQSSPKPKSSTLAGAFEKSNDQKYDFLGSHIEWEKEKFNKQDDRERDRFEWEKERFKEEKKEQLAKVEKQKQEDQSALEIRREEIALERARLEQQTKEKEDRKKIAIDMRAEGKSASEIEKFISLIYG